MRGIFIIIEFHHLMALIKGGNVESSVKGDNLTNVVRLTAENFEETIASNHNVVLFYAEG